MGLLEPAGQYAPAGHTLPVTPSVGALTVAPEVQKYPALQLPVGADSRIEAQNFPPSQGNAAAEPAGQYVPTAQPFPLVPDGVEVVVEPLQK